ncbi:hypothetical protein HBI56_118210 [Parastagonospora nodorum]|uniref:Uncharacterized protein n=1 Tax=Phaeosphaeria nodorum (strain SN15 / ATCC MYA-4574 / FGSC 10173) TaxID=321614 RepID=A0A7U2FCF5_PHANO|nr:hypothetical protein HBH56_056560 [Parastagonospora nodorum]QRD02488.1 hypothetical protein JI435_418130 [Parastagonospora nodorum SN15]KAH3921080.1 hypothetical protein HBH54_245690 [Parastagonospora nodorum]KAH3948816.1 hypothetical protein HBH53_096960 [Parastagonospora nodorum]KAH3988900.1 hypothetical protein HBH52_030980 [Parastagonospora nodorum]
MLSRGLASYVRRSSAPMLLHTVRCPVTMPNSIAPPHSKRNPISGEPCVHHDRSIAPDVPDIRFREITIALVFV